MAHETILTRLAIPALGRQADHRVGEKLRDIRIDFRGDRAKMNERTIPPG